VTHRLAGPFRGRGGQRCGGVEAAKAALGEAAGVARLDQQLGDRPGAETAELANVEPLWRTSASRAVVICFSSRSSVLICAW
jgi:hypothetical protein